MKDIIGYGALAVGGYLLWHWLNTSATIAQATAQPNPNLSSGLAPPTNSTLTQSGGSNASGTGVAVTTHTPTITGSSLRDKILQLSGMDTSGTQNADTWAYYWNLIQGSSSGEITSQDFDIMFIIPFNGDRSKLYTLDQFLNVMSTRGLAGFGMNQGSLGNIGLQTQGVTKLTATAYERAYKVPN